MLSMIRGLKSRAIHRLRHSRRLAALWRRLMWRTTVIAVTGSVGKTTCRELLYQILADRAPTYRTRNNENDAYGLPAVVLGLRPWHRFAVIEVAASGVGTLGPLARLVRPDMAVVTAVARTHTKNYPDIEAIAREKAELVQHLRADGIAVLNGDDPRVAAMRTRPTQTRIEFGREAGRAVRGLCVSARWPQRLQLRVTADGSTQPVQTQLVGEHWLNSVLAAYAVAQACGVAPADIAASIRRTPPFRGRMQPVALPNGATAISDLNASWDVFEAMVAVAENAEAARKFVVLDDLNDTGLNGAKARRKLAGRMVAQVFDVAVFFGQSAAKARNAAIAAGMHERNVHCAKNIGEVDALLKTQLSAGDLVFVKGRNLHHLNRLVHMQFGAVGCHKDVCSIRSDCEICPALRPAFDVSKIAVVPGRYEAQGPCVE